MQAFLPSTPLHLRTRSRGHACAANAPRTVCPIVAKKRPARKENTSDSFSGFAAGPGKPSRATRALGKRKISKKTIDTKKTAADFRAEGVVDDVEDVVGVEEFAEIAGLGTGGAVDSTDVAIDPRDIRFGIDDMEDPFLRDERIGEKAEAEAEAEAEVKAGDEAEAGVLDVSGDGGVLKTVLSAGSGEVARAGALVKVSYTGSHSGQVFDASKEGQPFSFTLGKGEVIKGWEAGVSTMRVGERATLKILPGYAYGRRGMPPVIPGNATLDFEIVLQELVGGEDEAIKRVAEFNPGVARTPDEIDAKYRERLRTSEERKKNMSLLERFYIISPFASQTGEKPPWWINPNITFVSIMLGVAIGFYLVFVSGAIHVGYVDQPVDVNIFK